jgi:hypothetical protein
VPAVPELDLAHIRRFCHSRVPAHLRDEARVEADLRGKSVTIFDCRPPWHPNLTDWSRVGDDPQAVELRGGLLLDPTFRHGCVGGRVYGTDGVTERGELGELAVALDALALAGSGFDAVGRPR